MQWPWKRTPAPASVSPIYFTNTLTGTKDVFSPIQAGIVSMYSCGPTVYGPQHIGNLRAALFADMIARVLMQAGYHVRRVINITDVGHLVGDGDEGEDKMAVGAKREHVTPEEIADRYAKLWLDDIRALNIDTDQITFPRATEYIQEQIAMVATLMEKGYAYEAQDGVYFDTSKFPSYGKLGGVAEVRLMGGARIKVEDGKRNFHDFALWRKAKPGDLQQWDSPWGRGNPGWHIECSAMIRSVLGLEIDIHTGGMDHIPVHHNNEIAQSEAANGRPLARYWLHEAFITIAGEKISKSLHNEVLLSDIVARGYHPLSLRYFYLQASFRTPISFTWEAIAAADEALHRLWRLSRDAMTESKGKVAPSEAERRFLIHARDDLATPAAIALLWETLRNEEIPASQKASLLRTADSILGLSLLNPPAAAEQLATEDLPQEIQELILERDEARGARDYKRADELREELEYRGYRVDDLPEGTKVSPVARP